MHRTIYQFTPEETDLMSRLFDAADIVGRCISRARHGLVSVPKDTVTKMIDAQQAIFAAQRILENERYK